MNNENQDAAPEAANPKLDQTIAGGRYKVGTRTVNAEGEPVSEPSRRSSDELPTETELGKMTKADLTAQAETEKIEVTESATNKEIVEAITSARK